MIRARVIITWESFSSNVTIFNLTSKDKIREIKKKLKIFRTIFSLVLKFSMGPIPNQIPSLELNIRKTL